MDFIKNPRAIEEKSMDLIDPFISDIDLTSEEITVYSRMIHASGDVDYGHLIATSKGAVAAGIDALAKGCNIYTDVNMVKRVLIRMLCLYWEERCFAAYPIRKSQNCQRKNIARSMAAMNSFGADLNGSIIGVGNAPTALYEAIRMVEEDGIKPALIIGIPVGFVGAADSKEQLVRKAPCPFITVRGTKGGSSIVASVINALMFNLVQRDHMLYVQGRK